MKSFILLTCVFALASAKALKKPSIEDHLDILFQFEDEDKPTIPPIPDFKAKVPLSKEFLMKELLEAIEAEEASDKKLAADVDPILNAGDVDPILNAGDVDPILNAEDVDPILNAGDVDPILNAGDVDPFQNDNDNEIILNEKVNPVMEELQSLFNDGLDAEPCHGIENQCKEDELCLKVNNEPTCLPLNE
eukprot:TRINITY_DN36_c0_g1_i6.p1 TRINITY_DN36_c0_g1~~TRINITY_DN36_c0_g1_i6.p1  ORF type:complete len:191 (-),score=74.19 TRINITY_DN36_c0_g1_i6:111-683(-)